MPRSWMLLEVVVVNRFVQQYSSRALVRFSIPSISQQGGRTLVTCCVQQCWDMLCSNVAIIWPGLEGVHEDVERYYRSWRFTALGVLVRYRMTPRTRVFVLFSSLLLRIISGQKMREFFSFQDKMYLF